MLPKTPDELHALLINTLMTRAYGDITTAARKGRLTEHDIAVIERKCLNFLKEAPSFANEFTTYEVEPVVAAAIKQAHDFFAAVRTGRIRQISEKA